MCPFLGQLVSILLTRPCNRIHCELLVKTIYNDQLNLEFSNQKKNIFYDSRTLAVSFFLDNLSFFYSV